MTEPPKMEYKQIILIRTDLDMGCGKKCVQVAHASLMMNDYLHEIGFKDNLQPWKDEGMRKIVLKVSSLEKLMEYIKTAQKDYIRSLVVTDFGLTQVEPNTVTTAAFEPLKVGSAKEIILSELTKDLKLL